MSLGEFLDCELHLSGGSVRLSAEGQEFEGELSFGPELDAQLLAAENQEDPIQYGQCLFKAIFANDKVRAGYSEILGCARRTEKRLQLRLYIAAAATNPDLHGRHWEYLYDPSHNFPLGCSSDTAFSRYLSGEQTARGPVSGVLRLLIVLAAPNKLEGRKLDPLDRDAMKRSIEDSLRSLAGSVDYRFVDPPVTLSKVRECLVESETHALLFQGHGVLRQDGEAAGLVLEDDEGDLAIHSEEEIADVLRDRHELRLVTLLACRTGTPSTEDPYSGLGPALIECGVPAVVAMRRRITLENASLFLRYFLINLGTTGRVDAAVNEARMQFHLRNQRSWDWGVPILFMRLEDGRLWKDPPPGDSPIRPPSPPVYDATWWRPILQQLKCRRVIPVLGPGLVFGLLPSKEEVAAALAVEEGFPWNGSACCNLPQVTQFVKTQSDDLYPGTRCCEILRDKLLELQPIHGPIGLEDPKNASLSKVIEQIAERYFASDPNEPHHILAQLPVDYYITTNIDNFMTVALKRVGNREPQREFCRWHEDTDPSALTGDYEHLKGTFARPLVFHLFGHDETPTRYQVLTEDDHLDFLRMIAFDKDLRIPAVLRDPLKNSILIFLGYKIEDLDCRVLFRGLVKTLGLDRNSDRNITVWQFPESTRSRENVIRKYVTKSCEGAEKIYFGSAREFLIDLLGHWEKIK